MGLDLTDIGQGDVEKEWNKIWVEQKIVFFFLQDELCQIKF